MPKTDAGESQHSITVPVYLLANLARYAECLAAGGDGLSFNVDDAQLAEEIGEARTAMLANSLP